MGLSDSLIESEVTLFLEENGYYFSFEFFKKKGYNHIIRFGKFPRDENRFMFNFWIGSNYTPVITNRKQIKTIKNLKLILGFLIESMVLIEKTMLEISENPDDLVVYHNETIIADHNMFFTPVSFMVSLYEEKYKSNQNYSIVNKLGFKDEHTGNLALILDNKDILVTNIYE